MPNQRVISALGDLTSQNCPVPVRALTIKGRLPAGIRIAGLANQLTDKDFRERSPRSKVVGSNGTPASGPRSPKDLLPFGRRHAVGGLRSVAFLVRQIEKGEGGQRLAT